MLKQFKKVYLLTCILPAFHVLKKKDVTVSMLFIWYYFSSNYLKFTKFGSSNNRYWRHGRHRSGRRLGVLFPASFPLKAAKINPRVVAPRDRHVVRLFCQFAWITHPMLSAFMSRANSPS